MPIPRALVLAAALATALAACSSSGASDEPGVSVSPGDVFPAVLRDDIVGDVATVQLPGRVYDVEVGRPRSSVDSVSAGEAEVSAEAPEGVAFVAVAWQPQPAEGDAIALGFGGPDVSPALSLTAGDETYPVGPLDQEGVFASWVAVPADATPIGVAVEFDGVTQTIEDMTDRHAMPEGASELLDGDPPGLHEPECPEPPDDPEPARYTISSCQVTATDPLPYHEQLGWAEEGRAWVVVRLSAQPIVVGWDDPGEGGAVVSYEAQPEDVTVTLDAAEPVDVLSTDDGRPAGLQEDGRWFGDAVFAVSADAADVEVVFTRPYTAVPLDPDEAAAEGTPAELTGTYEATIPLELG